MEGADALPIGLLGNVDVFDVEEVNLRRGVMVCQEETGVCRCRTVMIVFVRVIHIDFRL